MRSPYRNQRSAEASGEGRIDENDVGFGVVPDVVPEFCGSRFVAKWNSGRLVVSLKQVAR